MPCQETFTGPLNYKNIMKNSYFIALLSFLTFNSGAQQPLMNDTNKPLNIIIIIEEGLGLPAISAAQTIKGSDLNISKAHVIGITKTSSADDFVTDPASFGTAIACGIKTNNGVIGLDTLMQKSTNLFEMAKKEKMSVGFVTTSYVVDAVPAAFYAHQKSSSDYDSIAKNLLDSDLDVFIGGGRKYFRTKGDSTTLYKELNVKGYKILEDYGDLKTKSKKKLAGLIRSGEMQGILKGRGEYLDLAFQRAFRSLVKNDTGYILVIHDAHYNWAAANNEKNEMIAEIMDVDKVLGRILNMTLPENNTLVLVIGGFETGGVSVLGNRYSKTDPNIKFAAKHRTASMAPVFAFGPGALLFSGVYDNTDIFVKIKSLIE